MKIAEIENVKDKLNGWNDKFFDNFKEIIVKIWHDEASEEEIAVLSTGDLIEAFRGWEFQLPSTNEVLKYKGEAQVKIYFWEPEIDWDTKQPEIWVVKNIEDSPKVAIRFLTDVFCEELEQLN